MKLFQICIKNGILKKVIESLTIFLPKKHNMQNYFFQNKKASYEKKH